MLIFLYKSKICLLIIFLINIIVCEEINNSTNDNMLKTAKEKFFKREQKYLAEKPFSSELHEMIKRFKGRKFEARNKRGGSSTTEIEFHPKSPRAVLEATVTVPDDLNADFTQQDSNCESTEVIKGDKLSDVGAKKEETEDNQLFEQVIKDVDKLMKFKNEGKFAGREGALCNVTGYWDSEAGGAQIQLQLGETEKQGAQNLKVQLADRMPPDSNGFLNKKEWILSAELPFIHSTVIILRGFHEKDKKVVTFIGECRICEGKEGITGLWSVGRVSTSCNDREATHLTISDIWRKNNIKKLQDSHMSALGAMQSKSEAKNYKIC